MKKIHAIALLTVGLFLQQPNLVHAEVFCKNKVSGAVLSRPKKCKSSESLVQGVALAVKSTKALADNTTGLDLSVTRLNGQGGTLNTTGINLSVVGDTGGDSTNIGLLVNTAGADANYSGIFLGGNVGIGVSDPDEALELAGRFHLGQSSAPSSVSDKLYNLGGTLYWSGQAVAVGSQASGTITAVNAGTGLTGGGSSGSVTLNVNTGTSANDIVQLDSSGFLPALNGSNLTNLNATNLGSGTVPDARLSANVSLLGSSISLGSEVAGVLPVANGGTGASTLANLITLGTHTTGNYVMSVATGTGLSGGASGTPGAILTLTLDQAASPTWTATHSFQSSTNFGTATTSPEIMHVNGRVQLDQVTAPTTTTDKLYNVGGELFFNGKNLSSQAAGGDITAVNVGTGITGGGDTGDVTIAVDTGTAANKIVQLNSSAQLPAVSGINLTALNATTLTSGTIPDARLSSNVSLLGSSIGLTSEVSGILPVANGGTGASSLLDLIALGTNTTGNYVASLTAGSGITLTGGTASEAGTPTISVDTSTPFIWTAGQTFSGITTDITTVSNQDFSIVPNGTGKVGVGTTSPTAKLDATLISTSSTAATEIGAAVNVSDTGVVSSGTDTTIGSQINLTRTGASSSIINSTGLDININADTNGTSTATGINVNIATAADTNYAALFNGGKVGVGTASPTSNFETLYTSASTSPTSKIGNKFVVTDTGVVSSGTDEATGLYIGVSKSGGTVGSTTNTKGLDISVVGNALGTSTTTGLNVAVSGAAKNVAATFSGGSVSLGGSSSVTNANVPSGSLVIDSGALCVEGGSNHCGNALRTAGSIYAVTTSITGIDLAEEFPVEDGDSVEAGDIVFANTHKAMKCTASQSDSAGNLICTEQSEGMVPFVTKTHGTTTENKKVLGVVSTKPGVVLGGFGQEELIAYKKTPLALAGRVPVKISLENGALEVGDRITPSSAPGVGRKANEGEFSIGIALEPFGEEQQASGRVLALIK